MRLHPARRESHSAAPTAQHSPPWWASALDLQAPPTSVHLVRGCLPIPAYRKVRVHLAAGELGAATTTAGHPRSLGVAHQIPAKLGLRPEARISLAAGVAQDQSPETSEGY